MTQEETDRWHEEDLQRLKNFRLLDDDFMTKYFEDEPKYIQFVLRIVLRKRDLTVIDVHTRVLEENILNRSVRLEVVAMDSMGRVYNIIVYGAGMGAGRKRARYSSSMMDADILKQGENFDMLPETYVVFITENDIMGKGRPVYRIERYLDSGEKFEDGSHILYVNGAYRGDSPIGRLMHDFSCTDPAEMNYTALAERAKFFKEDTEGVTVMCKTLEDMRNECLKKGREEGIKEVALRMLKTGKYDEEDIAKVAMLPLDEVQGLAAENAPDEE